MGQTSSTTWSMLRVSFTWKLVVEQFAPWEPTKTVPKRVNRLPAKTAPGVGVYSGVIVHSAIALPVRWIGTWRKPVPPAAPRSRQSLTWPLLRTSALLLAQHVMRRSPPACVLESK